MTRATDVLFDRSRDAALLGKQRYSSAGLWTPETHESSEQIIREQNVKRAGLKLHPQRPSALTCSRGQQLSGNLGVDERPAASSVHRHSLAKEVDLESIVFRVHSDGYS